MFYKLWRKITENKIKKYVILFILPMFLVSILIYYFVSNNEEYYDYSIAKINSIEEESLPGDMIKQKIEATITNHGHRGEKIYVINTASLSQTYEIRYKVNDEIFVEINENELNQIVSSNILEYKRDSYLTYVFLIFIFLILVVGGIKGFRSLISVVTNVIIFIGVIELYLHGYSFIFIAVMASILFIVISILLVSGFNKKSFCAIISTIIGTIITMFIAKIVFIVTLSKGIHYEYLDSITRSPEKIFIVGLLVGTIGGIMDIAITMTSSIKELHDNNPYINKKDLIKSSMEIGKDVMGTMSNTLVFAYISGSIPIILFWLKNGFTISYVINVGISIEIIRALVGSIGAVLSIPISLYISIYFLENNSKEVE